MRKTTESLKRIFDENCQQIRGKFSGKLETLSFFFFKQNAKGKDSVRWLRVSQSFSHDQPIPSSSSNCHDCKHQIIKTSSS